MRDMFAEAPLRFKSFSLKLNDILFDYSKIIITGETMKYLYHLADECESSGWITKMFDGEAINNTESRAVLHTALRNRDGMPIMVDGEDTMPVVCEEHKRVKK